MDTETRGRILDEAIRWKNTPYHAKARKLGVGVDCGGLIYEIFNKWLPLPPFPKDYPEDWSLHKEKNERYLDFIQPFVQLIAIPHPADLVMWKFGRNFGHGSLYMGGGKYIHAWGKTGSGSVTISPEAFFSIGNRTPRGKKVYTVKGEYLGLFGC